MFRTQPSIRQTTPPTDVCDNPPNYEITGAVKCDALQEQLSDDLGNWTYADFNQLKIDTLEGLESENYAFREYHPLVGAITDGYPPV